LSKFYLCDKPKRLVNNNDGSFTIPDDINYYHKCVYFEDNPTKKFEAKIAKLSKDGYFGYYENGIYIEHERPKRVETHLKMPNVYFIPNYISYSLKCKYFDQNVGTIYDYSEKRLDS
jgi:hypothetical protein